MMEFARKSLNIGKGVAIPLLRTVLWFQTYKNGQEAAETANRSIRPRFAKAGNTRREKVERRRIEA